MNTCVNFELEGNPMDQSRFIIHIMCYYYFASLHGSLQSVSGTFSSDLGVAFPILCIRSGSRPGYCHISVIALDFELMLLGSALHVACLSQ